MLHPKVLFSYENLTDFQVDNEINDGFILLVQLSPPVWFCLILSLVSVMGTPSGQHQHSLHPVCKSWIGPTCSSHLVWLFFLFFSTSVLFWGFLVFFSFSSITFSASGYLLFFLWNWTTPVGQIIMPSFLPRSLCHSSWKALTPLEPRRLKRGAWERRNKRLSVCSHHHSTTLSLHSFFPPLVLLYSLSSLASAPN